MRAASIEAVASDAYNECGFDLGWAERAPSNAEFVDVMRDLIRDRLDKVDLAVWDAMSYADKRRLILRVGP
jgi:hypothetical protein